MSSGSHGAVSEVDSGRQENEMDMSKSYTFTKAEVIFYGGSVAALVHDDCIGRALTEPMAYVSRIWQVTLPEREIVELY
jgi:hypothetical protein